MAPSRSPGTPRLPPTLKPHSRPEAPSKSGDKDLAHGDLDGEALDGESLEGELLERSPEDEAWSESARNVAAGDDPDAASAVSAAVSPSGKPEAAAAAAAEGRACIGAPSVVGNAFADDDLPSNVGGTCDFRDGANLYPPRPPLGSTRSRKLDKLSASEDDEERAARRKDASGWPFGGCSCCGCFDGVRAGSGEETVLWGGQPAAASASSSSTRSDVSGMVHWSTATPGSACACKTMEMNKRTGMTLCIVTKLPTWPLMVRGVNASASLAK
mmetsp:Transcript_114847/g.365067  ORF Transcript_114847/g.365067 Transcript_114847/m.365067 type:complete len:271 (+) Transcript_114847:1365-2177(+)